MVEVEGETLSDHRYIVWALRLPRPPQMRAPRCPGEGDFPLPRRWALSRLDADRFKAAVLVATWHFEKEPGEWALSPQEGAEELVGIVASVCDAAMPQAHSRRRRVAYWWTEEIAELCDSSVYARRCLCRTRRRGGDVTRANESKEDYLYARKALRVAIAEVKRTAWKQMKSSLDDDPWGRPYKRVMGKTRPWAPPPTESLDSQALEGLLDICDVAISRSPVTRGGGPPRGSPGCRARPQSRGELRNFEE
ncbi:uncharacterized protein LOC105184307 [Harpegnathos saltator]|uniref:uncharacterized protein LOC105184307 n=1 Tax=Harpegnathos saltator TaxID=610380 RepID=UPI000DBED248|nr:uncharacterized protein LOC105184307 [Harpegnathos saltator]